MWTPSTSLSDGAYVIGLSEEDVPDVLSGDITISHNKSDNTISTSSKVSPSPTIGPSNSLDPVTVTPTHSSTPIAANSTPQSLNSQQFLTSHHTLKGGAIAGIAVGAVISTLLILTSAILC